MPRVAHGVGSQDQESQQGTPMSFPNKIVCYLECKFCSNRVCTRGMKAVLLADSQIELFSTDMPLMSQIQLIGADYTTSSCRCKICNLACLGCGNEIGYHITQPCHTCLKAGNNGHFWMFLMDCVQSFEKWDPKNQQVQTWSSLQPESEWEQNVYWLQAKTAFR